jgi:hypothetical protein
MEKKKIKQWNEKKKNIKKKEAKIIKGNSLIKKEIKNLLKCKKIKREIKGIDTYISYTNK